MMRIHRAQILRALACAGLLAVSAAPAAAQLPGASARAFGLGENFTALARGYNAVAWNPAGLALPGNPGFSIAILPTRGIVGLDPVTLSDFKEYEDELVPADVKSDWLDEIIEEGSQQGNGGADVTLLGLSVGPFALQVGTVMRTVMDISPDAAEVLLFGNVGREGEPRDFDLAGSSLQSFATTTVGVSYGHDLTDAFGILGTRIAVGATAKYVMGNFVVSGSCEVCELRSDPLEGEIVFPILQSDSSFGFSRDAGTGFGVDLGVAAERGMFTVAATIQNLINTFEWDDSKLFVRPGEVYFNQDSTVSSFDPEPVSGGSAAVQQRALDLVEDMKFKPAVSIGAAARVTPILTVTGDLRTRFGDGIALGPKTHAGVGAELRIVPFIPLRAGVAVLSEGYQLGGGIGVEVGGFNLNVSAARRESDLGTDTMGMLGISVGAR